MHTKQRPPDSPAGLLVRELGGRALQGDKCPKTPYAESISRRDVLTRQRETDCPLCHQPLRRPLGVCFAARPGIDGYLAPVEFVMHARCAARAAVVYDRDILN